MTLAKANRLLHEKSLYLRKHAYNPVAWWPWCAEARQLAQELDRPIFLSIGYSSCHWCTVMENEAFSDPAIANYLNDHFIAIKVDREERPDLDSIYMQALQLMQEQGGWPLNIFLTPNDLVPFYGGTYFSIDARYGRSGFLQILELLYAYYKHQKTDLNARKLRLMDVLTSSNHLGIGKSIAQDSLRPAASAILPAVTRQTQGISFPMIPYADFLLRLSRFSWQELHNALVERTLDRGLDLSLGGIFDQIGGGFHRYTVDSQWTVPHFEKMLYDNGQIIEYLSNLWRSGQQEPAFQRAVELTVNWLDREMTAPEGYFYASQDADSEGEEGKYYVWTLDALQAILGKTTVQQLEQEFFLSIAGNFEHGTNVFQRRNIGALSLDSEQALKILLANRQNRIAPVTDTKMIVAWNCLQISGLCAASVAFDRPDYLERATHCLQFILENQFLAGQLYRVNYEGTPKILATAEDYALLIRALLDIFEVTQNSSWFAAAQKIQTEFDTYLLDTESGGYYTARAANKDELIVREKDYQDDSTPAANGIAAQNLLRLFALSDQPTYLKQAEQILLAFTQIIEQFPRACPSLLSAVDLYWNLSLVQTFPESHSTQVKLQQAYYPTTVYKQILRPVDTEHAIALVCKGTTCLTPAKSEAELYAQLQEITERVN